MTDIFLGTGESVPSYQSVELLHVSIYFLFHEFCYFNLRLDTTLENCCILSISDVCSHCYPAPLDRWPAGHVTGDATCLVTNEPCQVSQYDTRYCSSGGCICHTTPAHKRGLKNCKARHRGKQMD